MVLVKKAGENDKKTGKCCQLLFGGRKSKQNQKWYLDLS